MIELHNVSRHFGGVRAVDGLDLTVGRGEVFGLIGPNGSGKSTVIHLISGLLPLTSGRIHFAGTDVSRLPAYRRAACGIARTFQNIRLFGRMTVWQNLCAPHHGGADRAWPNRWKRWLRGMRKAREDVEQALELWGLAHKRDQLAADLSFGEQRRLELARALVSRPRLLLLDEPAAGMTADEVDQLGERILWLRQRGLTILLVEHVLELVMNVADRIAVLNFGRKLAEGAPAQIRADREVRAAYLGESEP